MSLNVAGQGVPDNIIFVTEKIVVQEKKTDQWFEGIIYRIHDHVSFATTKPTLTNISQTSLPLVVIRL